MCSVGDDNFEDEVASNCLPVTEAKNIKLRTLCNKCRANKPSVLLRHNDVYCKDCFLSATVHKFKAFLGKHRFIYPNDRVIISLKEGQECAALLHLIRSGLDVSTPKKLRFHLVLLYIEHNYHLSVPERKKILENLQQQAHFLNFEVFFVSLQDYLKTNDSKEVIDKLSSNYQDIEIDANDLVFMNQSKNQTHKLQMMKLHEQNLLYIIAKHLKCKHILIPELGSHVAANLVNSLSLGRGAHLPLDIGICDNRDPEINVIRPLRHFEIKEIALYNYFNNVNVINLPEAANIAGSVQHLMRVFVDNLQTNFPATITTIVRTGDKLALHPDLSKQRICILCKAPIEMPTNELTASESTKFSRFISNRKTTDSSTSEENYDKEDESSNEYCYSCSVLVL